MAKVFAFGLIVTLSLNGSTCTIHRWDRARIAAMESTVPLDQPRASGRSV